MAKRIGTAVRLPAELLARLDAECDARVVSRNLIITKALEHYLDRLPPLPDAQDNGSPIPERPMADGGDCVWCKQDGCTPENEATCPCPHHQRRSLADPPSKADIEQMSKMPPGSRYTPSGRPTIPLDAPDSGREMDR